MVTDRVNLTDACGIFCSVAKSSQHSGLLHSASPRVEFRKSKNGNKKSKNGNFIGSKLRFCRDAIWAICVKPNKYTASLEHTVSCLPTRTHGSEAKECIRDPDDCSDISRAQIRDGEGGKLFDSLFMDQSGMPESTSACSSKGLAEACKYVYNDAKFVNERARNDIVLLSRGITRLNKRARQDVAILGLEFLKLDARAREDTEKIDHGMKKKAARLHHMAKILKEEAQSKLKKVADRHWSDGALDADLRRVDFCARRRAMEDAFMALEFVRNIHNMMVSTMSPLPRKEDSQSVNNMMKLITLKKNGKSLDFFPREVSTDQITAIQDAYLCMASALTEADGIDYTDPDELELLVATLIDLDAMDGKSSVSLLAECSSSPDVSTRQALANALAAAPSMWTLGNAGMGALQRLADDSNPAVASAASKAIEELKKQWKIEEGDCWMFTMNHKLTEDGGADADVEQDNPQ